ncbi:hypothetical protein BGW38_010693, partial [Lunasporangiospora selenospora]
MTVNLALLFDSASASSKDSPKVAQQKQKQPLPPKNNVPNFHTSSLLPPLKKRDLVYPAGSPLKPPATRPTHPPVQHAIAKGGKGPQRHHTVDAPQGEKGKDKGKGKTKDATLLFSQGSSWTTSSLGLGGPSLDDLKLSSPAQDDESDSDSDSSPIGSPTRIRHHFTALPEPQLAGRTRVRSRIKKSSKFSFTKAFGSSATWEELFDESCRPLLNSVLEREQYDALLLLYGVGDVASPHLNHTPSRSEQLGLVPEILSTLLGRISSGDKDTNNTAFLRPKGYQKAEMVDKSVPLTTTTHDQDIDSIRAMDKEFSVFAQKLGIACDDNLEDMDDIRFNLGDNEAGASLSENMECSVWLSCAEIHMERFYDLLAPPPSSPIPIDFALDPKRPALLLRSDPTCGQKYIHGLREVRVESIDEALVVLRAGIQQQRVFSSLRSKSSPNGHRIYTIKVLKTLREERSAPDNSFADAATVSRLCIVELAGCERTRSEGNNVASQQLREIGDINKSAMVLSHCLEVLRLNRQRRQLPHQVPYRQSKLTLLLQSVLEGKIPESQVSLVVNVDLRWEYEEILKAVKFSSTGSDVTSPSFTGLQKECTSPSSRIPISTRLKHGKDSPVKSPIRRLFDSPPKLPTNIGHSSVLLFDANHRNIYDSTLQSHVHELYEKLEASEERCRQIEEETRKVLSEEILAKIMSAMALTKSAELEKADTPETQSRATSPMEMLETRSRATSPILELIQLAKDTVETRSRASSPILELFQSIEDPVETCSRATSPMLELTQSTEKTVETCSQATSPILELIQLAKDTVETRSRASSPILELFQSIEKPEETCSRATSPILEWALPVEEKVETRSRGTSPFAEFMQPAKTPVETRSRATSPIVELMQAVLDEARTMDHDQIPRSAMIEKSLVFPDDPHSQSNEVSYLKNLAREKDKRIRILETQLEHQAKFFGAFKQWALSAPSFEPLQPLQPQAEENPLPHKDQNKRVSMDMDLDTDTETETEAATSGSVPNIDIVETSEGPQEPLPQNAADIMVDDESLANVSPIVDTDLVEAIQEADKPEEKSSSPDEDMTVSTEDEPSPPADVQESSLEKDTESLVIGKEQHASRDKTPPKGESDSTLPEHRENIEQEQEAVSDVGETISNNEEYEATSATHLESLMEPVNEPSVHTSTREDIAEKGSPEQSGNGTEPTTMAQDSIEETDLAEQISSSSHTEPECTDEVTATTHVDTTNPLLKSVDTSEPQVALMTTTKDKEATKDTLSDSESHLQQQSAHASITRHETPSDVKTLVQQPDKNRSAIVGASALRQQSQPLEDTDRTDSSVYEDAMEDTPTEGPSSEKPSPDRQPARPLIKDISLSLENIWHLIEGAGGTDNCPLTPVASESGSISPPYDGQALPRTNLTVTPDNRILTSFTIEDTSTDSSLVLSTIEESAIEPVISTEEPVETDEVDKRQSTIPVLMFDQVDMQPGYEEPSSPQMSSMMDVARRRSSSIGYMPESPSNMVQAETPPFTPPRPTLLESGNCTPFSVPMKSPPSAPHHAGSHFSSLWLNSIRELKMGQSSGSGSGETREQQAYGEENGELRTVNAMETAQPDPDFQPAKFKMETETEAVLMTPRKQKRKLRIEKAFLEDDMMESVEMSLPVA